LILGLSALGWRDAFRALHGYARRDRSWFRGGGSGYRLDHILVSPELRPRACDYLHHVREDGLSDHAAMWAEL
jgi:exonuclease III